MNKNFYDIVIQNIITYIKLQKRNIDNIPIYTDTSLYLHSNNHASCEVIKCYYQNQHILVMIEYDDLIDSTVIYIFTQDIEGYEVDIINMMWNNAIQSKVLEIYDLDKKISLLYDKKFRLIFINTNCFYIEDINTASLLFKIPNDISQKFIELEAKYFLSNESF